MHRAANAYANTARTTLPPRELEANLLLRAAQRLQAVSDGWPGAAGDLTDALTFNRRLWTILVSSATAPESPLPPALKQNLTQLAATIFLRTFDLTHEGDPAKIGLLVRINRDIAAGLRESARAPAAA